jgi:hypothetical protein
VKVPNLERARVDRGKVVNYLLSSKHPDGAHKAAYFGSYGFSPQRWHELAEALTEQARANPVCEMVESEYGTRYVVDGEADAPDGRRPYVRTVWIVEKGTEYPRLVTAHPVAGRGDRT